MPNETNDLWLLDTDTKERLLLARRLTQLVDRFTHEAVETALSQDDIGAIATLASPEAWTELPDPMQEARLRGAEMRQEMLREAGGTLSVQEAAETLGVTAEAIRKQVKRGGLIGIPQGRKHLIPAIQIEGDSLVPDLSRVLRAMHIQSPWMRLNWLISPEPRLGGVRPIDWMKDGRDIGKLIDVAVMEGEHGGD